MIKGHQISTGAQYVVSGSLGLGLFTFLHFIFYANLLVTFVCLLAYLYVDIKQELHH